MFTRDQTIKLGLGSNLSSEFVPYIRKFDYCKSNQKLELIRVGATDSDTQSINQSINFCLFTDQADKYTACYICIGKSVAGLYVAD